jgi:TonB family protein
MKTLTAPAAYGYQELRLHYQRYMMLALLAAILMQFAIVGGFYLSEWLKPTDPNTERKYLGGGREIDLGNYLPPLNPDAGLGITPTLPAILAKGIPVPVPDFALKEEFEFASQEQMGKEANQKAKEFGEGMGNGGGTFVIPEEPNDPSPEKFEPFEKEPVPVLTTVPKYPDLPLRAGIEGNVFIKVLITKEGKVKKAILMKTDNELFTQSAIDAAMKWVFTPAIMNGKPVLVWVAIPFRFRLGK